MSNCQLRGEGENWRTVTDPSVAFAFSGDERHFIISSLTRLPLDMGTTDKGMVALTLQPGETRAFVLHCPTVPAAFGYSLQPLAHGIAASNRQLEVTGGPQWFGPEAFCGMLDDSGCAGLVGAVEYELELDESSHSAAAADY